MGLPYSRGWILSLCIASILVGCQQSGSQHGSPAKSGTPQTPTSALKAANVNLSMSAAPASIYIADAKTKNCSTITVQATSKSDNKSLAGVVVNLALSGVATAEVATWGSFPVSVTTGEDGKATGTFCAAMKVGTAILVGTYKDSLAEISTANSNPIDITLKPAFTLSYKGSNLTTIGATVTDPIPMNLFESGPNDCGNLEFIIKKSDEPMAGVQLKFQSGFNYPTGTKLRSRSSTDQAFEVDPSTQLKFLSFTATSDSNGILRIPICSGSFPGSLTVSATYIDAYEKTINVKSPTITVGSGFANLQNLSLAFDPTNARTLRALFNNEMPAALPFAAKINAKSNSKLSILEPIQVHLESGGSTFNNNSGGIPNEQGEVGFSVLAAHNGSYRPAPVYYFSNSDAQTTCSPSAIANSNLTLPFRFTELAKNWRSTMVYMTRGQETYKDINDNKKYDVGGDGFWDKNQDGDYTQGVDAVTYFAPASIPAGSTPSCRCLGSPPYIPASGVQSTPCTEDPNQASCFRTNSEWFIDLPTPFIDSDENGIFEETVGGKDMDRLLNVETYEEPNGKRDSDTIIWKSTTLPVYTGTSIYAMTRAAIARDASGSGTTDAPTPGEYNPALTYLGWPLNIPRHADADTSINTASGGWIEHWKYVHAQGICGTPIPGGSDITVNIEPEEAEASDRQVTAHIYIQKFDNELDPSRRLLSAAIGSNTAKLNFNVMDHPAANASFPISYQLKVSPCKRVPQGGTGKWCSPSSYKIKTNVDGTFAESRLSVADFDASTCVAPTWKKNHTTYNCEACPKGTPKLNASNNCEACPTSTPWFTADNNQCNACPADTPKYESASNNCVACPSDKPRFVQASNTCAACAPNQTYNPADNTCVSNP
jgi:hypothetical protein